MRWPKRKLLLVALACLLSLMIAAIAVRSVAYQSALSADRARFADAKRTKTLIVASLKAKLGGRVDSERQQDECFHSEQGPYTEGVLWCQTATVVYLKNDTRYAELGQKYVTAASAQGWTSPKQHLNILNYVMTSGQTIECALEFRDTSGDHFGVPARSLLASLGFKVTSSPAFVIACADRAMEAYYPIVE